MSPRNNISLLLLGCCAIASLVNGVSSWRKIDRVRENFNYSKLIEEHNQHNDKYKCGSPQTVVVNSRELIETDIPPSSYMLPDVTVLRQCGYTSGCCPRRALCMAVNSSTQLLVFKEFYAGSGKKFRFHPVEVEQHLECRCIRSRIASAALHQDEEAYADYTEEEQDQAHDVSTEREGDAAHEISTKEEEEDAARDVAVY